MINIKMLKAGKGDSFIIEYKENLILIDGGLKATYITELKKKIKKKINLLIVTHIDNDHINGIVRMFEDPKFDPTTIEKMWFNSASLLDKNNKEKMLSIQEKGEEKGVKEGVYLEEELGKYEFWYNAPIKHGVFLDLGNIEIEVLAPFDGELKELNLKWTEEKLRIEKNKLIDELKDSGKSDYDISVDSLAILKDKVDTSTTNKSSIVILMKINEKNLLFTGDSNSEILVKALEKKGYSKKDPLKLEIMKLPHHGSKNNISKKLLELIECKNYLISSNGKGRQKHPDKECLSKIIDINKDKKIKFIFNYNIYEGIFSETDLEKYNCFECVNKNEINI